MTAAGTAPIPVLCLPFAGGGANVFRRCQEQPSTVVRIVPVQLPGREQRFDEPLYTDLHAAADGLLPEVLEQLDTGVAGAGVALFGHSLGAVLAFELAHRLQRVGRHPVRHLFASGSPGPWSTRRRRATGLSDDEFAGRVRELAGYSHPALEHPELREMLLPILRADVQMHENYRAAVAEPLAAPVTSVRGADDDLVSAADAAEWAAATSAGWRSVELPGSHMYLVDAPAALVGLLERTLTAVAP